MYLAAKVIIETWELLQRSNNYNLWKIDNQTLAMSGYYGVNDSISKIGEKDLGPKYHKKRIVCKKL